MAEQTMAQGPMGTLVALFPVLVMFLIFYVLVFRPQAKARKTHEQMVKNLKKHDEVVTAGGMFGTVVNVRPGAITLRVDENVRVEVEPSAITRLVKSRSSESEPAEAPRLVGAGTGREEKRR
jgi:preprotein translocase subunit YajC